MEDSSLHGFRFRPQSPLIIPDQIEADHIKVEDEEGQESLEYEELLNQPRPPNYHKSNEVLIAEHHRDRCHHAQRFSDVLPKVTRKYHKDLRQSDPADPDFSNNYPPLTFKSKTEAYDADPLWYQPCSPVAQPLKVEGFDEPTWQIPKPETPVKRYSLHESAIEPDEQEYSERESESGASTMTLIDVPEGEDDIYKMTVSSIDEDSFEDNEPFEDALSEGQGTVDEYRLESEDDDKDEDEDKCDDDDDDESEEDDSEEQSEGEGDSESEQGGELDEEAEFIMQPTGFILDMEEFLYGDDDYHYEI